MKPRYDLTPATSNQVSRLREYVPSPFSRSFSFLRAFSEFPLGADWGYRLLNLVTMNRPKAAVHMEGSRHPPTGMGKNSRKLGLPKRAIRVASTQFPCQSGSLEVAKINCRTG